MNDWYHPTWWRESAYPALIDRLSERYFDYFPRNRCSVMAEDWDNLLILDACRYDVFRDVNGIPGALGHRYSRGSNTGEFFEENFAGTTQHDTVYVTANPVPRVETWCDVDIDAVFHAVVDVWEHDWDETLNTVRPEPVADAIREAHAEYPDKRILGHFVQPHQPFIGERGLEIEERGMSAYDRLLEKESRPGKKVWEQLEDGDLSADQVRDAYTENLELVLPHVRDLCEDLSGKTVVSSDHGNLFGEFAWPFPVRRYGHPRGVHTEKLVKVPWLETDFETRRDVSAERPVNAEPETERQDRLERLQHLGYG